MDVFVMADDNVFSKSEWDKIIKNILRNSNWGEYKLIKILGIGEPHYITNVYFLMKTRGKDEYHKILFEISTRSLEITDSGRVWGGCYDDSTLDDVYQQGFINNAEYMDLRKRFVLRNNIIG